MASHLNHAEVRYEASDTFGEPGRYIHVPSGDLVVWINASNQESTHAPSGHFERYQGKAEEYKPMRTEAP